jgi:hypothetical protein
MRSGATLDLSTQEEELEFEDPYEDELEEEEMYAVLSSSPCMRYSAPVSVQKRMRMPWKLKGKTKANGRMRRTKRKKKKRKRKKKKQVRISPLVCCNFSPPAIFLVPFHAKGTSNASRERSN